MGNQHIFDKLKKGLIVVSVSGLTLSVPFFAFAQTINNLADLIYKFVDLLALILPVILALALLYFFWGLANFILYADNEQKRAEGRQIMLWGVIVFFLLLSVGAIIAVLRRTFGFL